MVEGTRQKRSEYEKFEQAVQELIRVPHSQIKAALDAEKAAKKRKKLKKSSASREEV
jgi:hypothetical protein